MEFENEHARRASAILAAERLRIAGLSAAEISRSLKRSHGIALSRSAVLGVLSRIDEARRSDARDLQILAAVDAGHSFDAIAARFDVSKIHVKALVSECPQ